MGEADSLRYEALRQCDQVGRGGDFPVHLLFSEVSDGGGPGEEAKLADGGEHPSERLLRSFLDEAGRVASREPPLLSSRGSSLREGEGDLAAASVRRNAGGAKRGQQEGLRPDDETDVAAGLRRAGGGDGFRGDLGSDDAGRVGRGGVTPQRSLSAVADVVGVPAVAGVFCARCASGAAAVAAELVAVAVTAAAGESAAIASRGARGVGGERPGVAGDVAVRVCAGTVGDAAIVGEWCEG